MEHFPCPACGTALTTGQNSCPHCGIQLTYRCSQCGNAVEPQLMYCTHCGAKLLWNTSEQQNQVTTESTEPGPDPTDMILEQITNVETRSLAAAFLNEIRNLQPNRIVCAPVLWCIVIKTSGKMAAYLWPMSKICMLTYRNRSGKWAHAEVYDRQSYVKSLEFIQQSLIITDRV